MEFKEYMDAVRNALTQMQEQEKTDMLTEIARVLPENRREGFLDFLRGKEAADVKIDLTEIEEWCQKVENEELYFDTKLEEYYEDGEWERDFKTLYIDNMNIIPKLTDILNGLHGLLLKKQYEVAYKMLRRIGGLSFLAVSEWYDDDQLSFWRLMDEKLLMKERKEAEKDLLYSCCQGWNADHRLAELYELLSDQCCKNISVADILAYGPEEIHDTDAFMTSWLSYLKMQLEDRAAYLLEEACIYVGGISLLKETAMEEGKKHPYLLKALCERYSRDELWQECLDSVQQGLRLLPKTLMIRGEIADYGIAAAGHLGCGDIEKALVKEAFISQPTGDHFLRIFLHYDSEEWREILKKLASIPVKERRSFFGVSAEQKQSEMQKRNIASETLKQIFQVMLGDFFQTCFQAWKSSFTLSEQQRQDCLELLRNKVAKRTEAVVGGGYRGSYHKAAEIIVVMGEIEEDLGKVNGAENLAEYYRKQHSRKYAFRGELNGLLEVVSCLQ